MVPAGTLVLFSALYFGVRFVKFPLSVALEVDSLRREMLALPLIRANSSIDVG
jgi:hypothetical protein